MLLKSSFFIVMISAVLFAGPRNSQQSQDPLARIGNKAYSVPISNKLIQFQVKLQIGNVTEPFAFSALEGGMAKIMAFKGGFAYAIVPVLSHVDDQTVEFHIFSVARDDSGNESLRELENVKSRLGSGVLTSHEPKLEIIFQGVASVDPSTLGLSISKRTVPGRQS